MSVTSSYTEVVDSYNIVGCGWYTADSVIYSASIYRIASDGTFKWFYNLDPNASTKKNLCYGIVYDTTS